MKYYVFIDYDSGEKFLFDNLNSAMEFVKDYQIHNIEEYGQMFGSFSLIEIPVINLNFKDWLEKNGNEEIDNKILVDTEEDAY